MAGKVAGQCVSVGSNQVICMDQASGPLGGTYMDATTAAVWSSGAAGGTFTPDASTLNATWTPPLGYSGIATLTLTATTGCATTPLNVSLTITVRSNPVATISGSTTVCKDEAPPVISFTNLESSDITITYNINSGSPLTIGVNSGSTTNVPVLTGTAGTFVYSMESVEYQDSPECINYIAPSATVVVQSSVGGSVSSLQTICYDSQPANLTLSLNTGDVLRWEKSASAGFSSPTTIPVTSVTLTGATIGNLTSDTYFRAVVQNGTCTAVPSSGVLITVRGVKTASISGGVSPICNGTSPGLFTATGSGGGGSFTYQWYNTSGIIDGATNSTFNPGNITASTSYYCVLTTPSCGTVSTPSTAITALPLPTLTGVSQAAQVCSGNPATINLSGLLAGTTSMVDYSINDIPQAAVSGITAASPGFQTAALTPASNGKMLKITGITITSSAPNCHRDFNISTPSPLIVNTALIPVITGPSDPCLTSDERTYTTETGMTTYVWSISAGGDITGGGGSSDDYVEVTWNTAGACSVSVSYTNGGGCPTGSAVKPLNVIAIPVPSITGPSSVCYNSTGNVYTTQAGMVNYDWSIDGGTITGGGDGSNVAVVKWTSAGSRSISVNYTNLSGCSATTAFVYSVTVNPLPVPVIIGPADPRVTSTANIYSTESSMSNYVWSVSGGGLKTSGGGLTDNSIAITWNTSGSQLVSVNYTDGNTCLAPTPTSRIIDVVPLPLVTSVYITGTPSVGSVLSGHYSYSDVSAEGISILKWIRNGTDVISGANSLTYTPVSADLDKTITFEVTPVSTTGNPNTGLPVRSLPTETVEDLSGTPFADEVCIEGVRAGGNTIRGRYRYNYPVKAEGHSTYQWYRNTGPISGADDVTYVLDQTLDINSNADIRFEVTPVSSNHTPKIGVAVKSEPMARITMPKSVFSITEPEVTLTANSMGGIFSGPGVIAGVFSPLRAGTAGSPHTIEYLLNIVNSSNVCSQQASEEVIVSTTAAVLEGTKDFYCHDGTVETIRVRNVPDVSSTVIGFNLTNSAGLVSTMRAISPTEYEIDMNPSKLRPGVYKDTLSFSYIHNLIPYKVSHALIIDSIGASMRIINLAPKYCLDTEKQYISVEGIYPPGGTYDWTGGAILTGSTVASADIEPSKGIAGNLYTITYQYTSPQGCLSNVPPKSVRINGLPDPMFSLNPTYNIEGGSVVLNPVRSGGIFIGKNSADIEKGISGSTLFPDIAGLGPFRVTYKITDSLSCSATKELPTVIRKAGVTIIGIPSVICYMDTTIRVGIDNFPGTGFAIIGFRNKKNTISYTTGEDRAYYNVVAAGAGMDTIVFSYKWDDVDYSVSKGILIDSLGQVEIKNLFPGDEICNNEPKYELFTTQAGGVFTGPFTLGFFDPSLTTGPTKVTYKYINPGTGCSTSVEIPITIFPAPEVSFIPKDYCIDNDTDTTFFTNNTVSADEIQNWLWEFADEGGSETRSDKDPGYLYKNGGFYKVTLTATTINNCSATEFLDFDMGFKPEADFFWKKDCLHPIDSLELFDTTFSTSSIISRSWEFGEDAPVLNVKNPKYPKISEGFIPVRYIVKTNYSNCSDTIFKNIYIRPSILIPPDGYFEDFEAGHGGWMKDDTSSYSWIFGLPDKLVIDNAASGVNAWFTSDSLINQKVESASIISPCFDFTTIERPMISLKLRSKFNRDRDGAVLQYKIADLGIWQPVGTIEDGINWFNSPLIKGRPGGGQIGWTTKDDRDTIWREARHTIDELKGMKDVKFRIAYGSDGTAQDNEGIAFDDIRINERSRNVLIEHFTNSSCFESKRANALVNDIALNNAEDVINIQYHTNFPGTDPFYDANPGDVSARILSYGLTRTPYSFIDGGTGMDDFSNIYDYIIADIDNSDILKRSLIHPQFNISLMPVVSGNILTVTVKLTALEDINVNNLTLFIAVTEKENDVQIGNNGETVFYNVFRKFLPDAGGVILKQTWARGESFTLPDQTWLIEKIINTSDIDVVAFIQNISSKEVFQAVSEKGPDIIVGIDKMFPDKSTGFSLYPNPAKEWLTLNFEEPLSAKADIRIYDFQGMLISSYKAGSGSTEFTIENPGLKGGIYLVRLSSGGMDLGFRKLVITGN